MTSSCCSWRRFPNCLQKTTRTHYYIWRIAGDRDGIVTKAHGFVRSLCNLWHLCSFLDTLKPFYITYGSIVYLLTIFKLIKNLNHQSLLFCLVFWSRIGLITVSDAILTGRQSGQKLQCLYGNPMAKNFFQNRILHKLWIAMLKYQVEDCIHQVWRL